MTPRATAIMVVGANAPDFDAVMFFTSRADYLHYHRNITHALVAIPAMALITVALVRVIGKQKVRWLQAWLIAMVAVISHLVLDLTNVYGVRLGLPFTGAWSRWDLTPVIDFSIWAILLLGVAAPMLSRLVGSEIGEQRSDGGKAGWAVAALLLFTAYDYSRSLFHDRALALMESRTWNGYGARRVAAFPTANPLIWTGMAEISNAYVSVPIDLRGGFHPSDAVTYYKAERIPAEDAAMATHTFQRLLEFVQFPLWVVEPAPEPEGAVRVRLLDLRFGTPGSSGFAATALVDRSNRVLESEFGFGGPRIH